MGKSRSEGFVDRTVAVLRRERLRQGMSHEKLAEAAGVHRSTISRTERGLMSPTLHVIHAMASALNLDLAKVVSEADPKRRE